MIVHLDTSALVDALTGPRRSLPRLIGFVESGHRIGLSTLVLYEWLRGPRTRADLAVQEELLPQRDAVVFGAGEAAVASRLYTALSRPRGREIDLAIAACAIASDAALWTLNQSDFQDIGDLRLL